MATEPVTPRTMEKGGPFDYDLAVIGGGPGGYVAAICGARKGLRTVLIEKDALGGTCLNRGCIPTKSFVHDTRLFKSALTSPVIGGTEQLRLDTARLLERKNAVVETLVSGVAGLVKSNGVALMPGRGVLRGPGRVSVSGPDGDIVDLRVTHVVLANGSTPAVPPFIPVDGRFVQTTDHILNDPAFPERILIIGGGVIGIEMAAIFLNAGAAVTLIEMLPDILMTEDKDVRGEMTRQLKKRRAKVLVNTSVEGLAVADDRVTATFRKRGAPASETLTVDKVLVATGRAPVLDGIDTDALGIEKNGPFIRVDSRFETSLPGVYAIGDLIGGMMLAHKASAEAEAVVEKITGGDRHVDPHLIPRCIWGVLEVGAAGMTEEEAVKTGRKIKTGRFSFLASGAARALNHAEGFVKIVGDADTGEILGMHIIGGHATELIGQAAAVMTMEGAVEDFSESVMPHPTLSEALMEAALDWNGLAVHIPRKAAR